MCLFAPTYTSLDTNSNKSPTTSSNNNTDFQTHTQVDQAITHMQLWRHKYDATYTVNAYDLTDLQPDRDLLDLI